MITLTDVSYRYGNRQALDGVTLSFPPNQVCGLLGLNGAGKSTLLKILAGCFAPDTGRVEIDGVDIGIDRKPLARVGYLPEIPPLYPDLTVGEQLSHAARIKDLARAGDQVRRVMAATDIENASRRLIGNLSKGYRQRVGIAQALLGDPSVVILDEPTVGLDPGQLHAVREMLAELAHERTIIFSSHILSEVQAVSDSVTILAKGRVMAAGTLEELTRQASATGLLVTLDGVGDHVHADFHGLEGLEGLERSECLEESDESVTLRLVCPDTRVMRRRVFDMAAAKGWSVLELRSLDTRLEDIFAAYAAEG